MFSDVSYVQGFVTRGQVRFDVYKPSKSARLSFDKRCILILWGFGVEFKGCAPTGAFTDASSQRATGVRSRSDPGERHGKIRKER